MSTFSTLMADAITRSCFEQELPVSQDQSNGTINVSRLHMVDGLPDSYVHRHITCKRGVDERYVTVEVSCSLGATATYQVDYIGGDLKIDKILGHIK